MSQRKQPKKQPRPDTGSRTNKRRKRRLPDPSLDQLETELKAVNYRTRYRSVLSSTIFTLVVVAAVAVLVAMLFLPVLKISGGSMTPLLNKGDIVLALKSDKMSVGDIVAFYYNNDILVKRVTAGPGDWIDIDLDGNVFRNGDYLEEPYLEEKAYGECNIKFPYQVPDERFFVMGDHRSTSIDSRHTTVGCVSEEQMVGRIVFRIWPMDRLGFVN